MYLTFQPRGWGQQLTPTHTGKGRTAIKLLPPKLQLVLTHARLEELMFRRNHPANVNIWPTLASYLLFGDPPYQR